MARPNIVFLSIDSLRYDIPSAQTDVTYFQEIGVPKPRAMACLDEWIGRSVYFPRAVSVSTYTTSAHASVFTGVHPPRHGIRKFLRTTLYPGVPTLAETLSEAGYRCLFFSDMERLFRYNGLMRGFETFPKRDAEVLEELDRPDDRPIFLFLHFLDVHTPYLWTFGGQGPDPNGDYRNRVEALEAEHAPGYKGPSWAEDPMGWNRYHRAVRRLSKHPEGRQVQFRLYLDGARKFDQGRFRLLMGELSRRPFWNHLLFAGFSDHGEGFEPGGRMLCHAGSLAEGVVRIPLFLWRSGGAAPRVAEGTASLVDLAPTALDAAGIDSGAASAEGGAEGISLLPAFDGRAVPDRFLYQEVWVKEVHREIEIGRSRDDSEWLERSLRSDYVLHQRAVRKGRLKLTVSGLAVRRFWRAARGLPAADFVRRLYRDFLGRADDPEGFRSNLAWMEARGGGIFARYFLLVRFARSSESRNRPKYLLHDYIADPLARRPLAAGFGLRGLWKRRSMLRSLERISRLDRDPAPLIQMETRAEEQETARLLQGLGYLDGGP